MGLSHSLVWRQTLLEQTACKAKGLVQSNRFPDREVAPAMNLAVHSEYIDNFVAFWRTESRLRAIGGASALASHGLKSHPVETTVMGEALGSYFKDDSFVEANESSNGAPSGMELEVLLGHSTRVFLIRRVLLSRFSAVFTLTLAHKRYKHRRTKLWSSVRGELSWSRALVCFVRRDLGAT